MEQANIPRHEAESTTTRPLPIAAHAALRCALGGQLRRSVYDEPISTPQMRRALRLLCEDARRRGVRAEQLVVVIKQAWASLPETRWRPGDDRGAVILERVVSLCIEEYYAAVAGDAPVAGAPAPIASRHD